VLIAANAKKVRHSVQMCCTSARFSAAGTDRSRAVQQAHAAAAQRVDSTICLQQQQALHWEPEKS
jgi:hypothetical protein